MKTVPPPPPAKTRTPAEASNIIDGDAATSWNAQSGTPIVIDLGSLQKIKEFELTRVESTASLGTSPDILIELSTDNTNYKKSQVSTVMNVSGGESCSSVSASKTRMFCAMTPAKNIRYVRITIATGKAFDLTEFKTIAE